MVFAVRKAVFPPASPPGVGAGGLLGVSGDSVGVLRGLLTEFVSAGEGETFFKAGFRARGF